MKILKSIVSISLLVAVNSLPINITSTKTVSDIGYNSTNNDIISTQDNGEYLGSVHDRVFPNDWELIIKAGEKINFEKLRGHRYKDDNGYVYHIEEKTTVLSGSSSNNVCKTYSSVYMPYTGFRFLGVSVLSRLARYNRYSILVYCHQGKEAARSIQPYSGDKKDILWGTKYCFTDNSNVDNDGTTPKVTGCYIPVRSARNWARESFTGNNWNQPERIYGGLFTYGKGGRRNVVYDNLYAIPVAPLIFDEPYMGFIELTSMRKTVLHVPCAYTPDYYGPSYPMFSDIWAQYMDINEVYTYKLPSSELPLGLRLEEELVKQIQDLLGGTGLEDKFIANMFSKSAEKREIGGDNDGSVNATAGDSRDDMKEVEFQTLLDQIKSRLVLLEDKHLAKYIYMGVYYLVSGS